jgi:uncharacterized protein (UPF0548 family)
MEPKPPVPVSSTGTEYRRTKSESQQLSLLFFNSFFTSPSSSLDCFFHSIVNKSMFILSKPSHDFVREFLTSQAKLPFSYSAVGHSQHSPPSGYNVDHNRIHLGNGIDTFERAKLAVRQWKMFAMPWIEFYWPDIPIETGACVAVLVRHFALWSLNACRIVYLVEEPLEKFGFAYGTLPDHAERGEERFIVEYNRAEQSVWYDLYAYSRPKLLAEVAYPVARALQKKFARDSLTAMKNVVQNQPSFMQQKERTWD